MNNEKMGSFIAEQRKSKGMTQLDLANKLHITDKAVSKWERGLSSPDIGLLPQLADSLGVSVNALLKGEFVDETTSNSASSVSKVTDHTEKAVQKKYSKIKLILSSGFSVLLLIGITICAVIDIATTNSFTWSLYPISSIIFMWCVLFPVVLLGRKGIILSMIVLTFITVPYLFVLDKIVTAEGIILRIGAVVTAAEGKILKVGTVVAAIFLIFLWIAWFIMKRSKKRRLLGAGISTILAVPVCVLINCSLALTVAPEAGSFDAWDVLGIVVFAIVGLMLISFDLIINKKDKLLVQD